MLRLFRMPLLCLLCFAGGVMFERFAQTDACLDAGGALDPDGLCLVEARGNG